MWGWIGVIVGNSQKVLFRQAGAGIFLLTSLIVIESINSSRLANQIAIMEKIGMAEYILFSLLGENQSIWWNSMSMVVVLIMVNDV